MSDNSLWFSVVMLNFVVLFIVISDFQEDMQDKELKPNPAWDKFMQSINNEINVYLEEPIKLLSNPFFWMIALVVSIPVIRYAIWHFNQFVPDRREKRSTLS